VVTFRQFETSKGKEVLAGKSAENNEDLVAQVSENEIVLHTALPGSPFVNIKASAKDVTKKDLKETAVVCAFYSQDWRDNRKDVIVHVFSGKDIYKEKKMKTGTFGVNKFKEMKVKKQDILNFEKELKNESS